MKDGRGVGAQAEYGRRQIKSPLGSVEATRGVKRRARVGRMTGIVERQVGRVEQSG
jgi:hypothetical protein